MTDCATPESAGPPTTGVAVSNQRGAAQRNCSSKLGGTPLEQNITVLKQCALSLSINSAKLKAEVEAECCTTTADSLCAVRTQLERETLQHKGHNASAQGS